MNRNTNPVTESNPTALRKMLEECEEEMIKLSYHYRDGEKCICVSNQMQVLELADNRGNILNRLFALHFNSADKDALQATNLRLEMAEKDIAQKHCILFQQLQSVNEKFTLRTTMFYDFDEENPHLAPIQDEDYYDSRWSVVHEILSSYMFLDNEIFECDDGGLTPYTDGWRVYTPRLSDLPDEASVDLCYSFHQLLAYQHFSIPDVLKMTSFSYRQEPLLYDKMTIL